MPDNSTAEPATLPKPGCQLETRIVEVGPMPDSALFKGLSTRRERLSALTRYFAARKKMITEHLLEMKEVTVKDLSSSNTLIVTAPEDAWLALVGKGGLLDQDGIRIHRNQSLSAHGSGKAIV